MIQETIEKLTDKDPHVRYQALKVLAAQDAGGHSPEALQAVVRICRTDKLPYNRLEAMNVLGGHWDVEGVPEAFSERLGDEAYIAEAAVGLLGRIATPGAYALLRKTYQDKQDVHVRLQVIQAYQSAPQGSVLEFLQVSRAHESEDDRIRATVVALLATYRNATLKPVFFKALRDDNARVRANAVEALTSICSGEELLQVLARFTKDRSNRVRANAIKGLLDVGVHQAEGLLHEMAHHRNPRYRSSAAWVLGEVGHRVSNGVAWLRQLAEDADNNVTYRAEMAVKKLHTATQMAAA